MSDAAKEEEPFQVPDDSKPQFEDLSLTAPEHVLMVAPPTPAITVTDTSAMSTK